MYTHTGAHAAPGSAHAAAALRALLSSPPRSAASRSPPGPAQRRLRAPYSALPARSRCRHRAQVRPAVIRHGSPRVPREGIVAGLWRCVSSRRVPSLTSCSLRAVRVASSRSSLLWARRGCSPSPAGIARAARTSSRCCSRSTWSSWRPARAACSLSPTRPRSQPPARGAPSSILSAGPRPRPWQWGGGEAAGLVPLRAVSAARAARTAPLLAAERVQGGRGGSCGFGGEVGKGEGVREGGGREGKRAAAPGLPLGVGMSGEKPAPVRCLLPARGGSCLHAPTPAPGAARASVPSRRRGRAGRPPFVLGRGLLTSWGAPIPAGTEHPAESTAGACRAGV